MAFQSAQSCHFPKEQVAIAITHGAFGSHVGLAFHTAQDGLKLLHLAWHKQLKVDDFPPFDCWICSVPELPGAASKQLVGIVRAIAKRKPAISYGIDFIAAKGSFDASGHYKPPRGSTGLTCASFVTEIFRASRMPLINDSTWQLSEENIEWGHKVAALLKKHGADDEHVAAVQSAATGLRIRPEEVGAASEAALKDRPVAYLAAVHGAKEVMLNLHVICPK